MRHGLSVRLFVRLNPIGKVLKYLDPDGDEDTDTRRDGKND